MINKKKETISEEDEDDGTVFSYLRREDFYEFNNVGTKARTNKTCDCCGELIPKGQPHSVAKMYPEFASYPVHLKCKETFLSKLKHNGTTS